MHEPNTDVIQGTLDMLILQKRSSLETDAWLRYSLAGIEQISRAASSKSIPGRSLPAFQTAGSASGGWIPSGARPITPAGRSSIRSLALGENSLKSRQADWNRRASCR